MAIDYGFHNLSTSGNITANSGIILSTPPLTGSSATSVIDVAQTWNTTGTPTLIKTNVTDTASNASSLLMDLQVGGSSKFSVRKDGQVTIVFPTNGRGISVNGNGDAFIASAFGSDITGLSAYGLRLQSTNTLTWASTSNGPGNAELTLVRDAPHTLGQRNAGNAQRFNLYGTFSTSTNFERMFLEYNTTGTAFRIGTEKGSGGGSARALELQTDGTTRLTIRSDGQSVFTNNICLQDVNGTIISHVGIAIATGYLAWRNGAGTSVDTALFRDAAATLAQRFGTTAQRFNLYGTFSTSTNFERMFLEYNTTGTAFRVGTEKGSGGGTARSLEFQTDGTTRFRIANDGDSSFTGKVSASGSIFSHSIIQASGFTQSSGTFQTQNSSFTLSTSHNGATILSSGTSQINVTVPTGLPLGFGVAFIQSGAGAIYCSGDANVTIRNRQNHTKSNGQWAVISLVQFSQDNFIIAGDTAT